MKPAPFDYHQPETVDGAVELLADLGWEAKILAGGQSLVPMLNLRLARPAHLIDLKRVPLDEITDTGASLRLGSTVRQYRLIEEPVVGDRLPVLAHAAGFIAHPAIRNRGTIGGSIAHADPAAELALMSILLDARMQLRSRSGARSVPADEFFLGTFTTALDETEIIETVEFDYTTSPSSFGFSEIAQREGDFALASAAVVIEGDRARVSGARVAVAGGSEVPIRLPEVERLLAGSADIDAATEAAREIAMSAVDPMDDIHATSAHRRVLVGEMVARSVRQALGERS